MRKEEQERWNKMVLTHWWVRGHQDIAKGLIKKYLEPLVNSDTKILDIGCSGGYIGDFLSQFGKVYGLDVSFEGLLYCKNKNLKAVNNDAVKICFKDNIFDVITILEVAEHIEDDSVLFSEIYRVCKKSGLIFVMLPAYKFLWGSHDVKYSHKRRYDRREFINLIKGYDFEIERLTFMHPYLLGPLIFMRFWDRVNKNRMGQRDDFLSLNPFLDNILYKILMLEKEIIKNIDFSFGICIFSILRKV
jgi:SAM-dependent methyltransferase